MRKNSENPLCTLLIDVRGRLHKVRKLFVNSFRQIQKHEDMQDVITMMTLIFLFGFAVIASAGKLF